MRFCSSSSAPRCATLTTSQGSRSMYVHLVGKRPLSRQGMGMHLPRASKKRGRVPSCWRSAMGLRFGKDRCTLQVRGQRYIVGAVVHCVAPADAVSGVARWRRHELNPKRKRRRWITLSLDSIWKPQLIWCYCEIIINRYPPNTNMLRSICEYKLSIYTA